MVKIALPSPGRADVRKTGANILSVFTCVRGIVWDAGDLPKIRGSLLELCRVFGSIIQLLGCCFVEEKAFWLSCAFYVDLGSGLASL